jgi:hypothetical protein
MDFDDQRDYMDQDIHAGQFLTSQFGPIAQFFYDMPDSMNMTPEDINLAVENLPNPSDGHILPGISLQEAIEVNEWHHIHDRLTRSSNQLVMCIRYRIPISYTISLYVYDIVFDIVHDIVYDDLPDVLFLKLSRADVLGRVPLIPCCLNGNSFNTIPRRVRGKIPREAAADSGSLLFEINMWMWRHGRTYPRQIILKYLRSKL